MFVAAMLGAETVNAIYITNCNIYLYYILLSCFGQLFGIPLVVDVVFLLGWTPSFKIVFLV